jgi:hypothetical protein
VTSEVPDDDSIRCFGCRRLFDGWADYWRHSEGADCQLTGETLVSSNAG